MTQQEGMIFESYSNFLDKLPEFFAKPLGSCIICNGTWIFIIAFILEKVPFDCRVIPVFISLFLGMGINYIWIELMGKVINQE
jgi:hypothetical protein